MTLIELLMATAIMAIMAAALGTLAMTVQTSSRISQGDDTATQHARVTLERIQRTLHTATTSANFPGFAVIDEQVGPWRFPDTLVVWRPESTAANPSGLPLFRELVVFCPDPNQPSQLLEITAPNDNRPTPPLTDTAAWRNELTTLKTSNSARRIVLSSLLRAASADGSGSSQSMRGAVRFTVAIRPAVQQYNDYQAGGLNWQDMAWVQDIYGSTSGVRQSWCSIELQLLPEESASSTGSSTDSALPFFGSAALYYELVK
jgi:type II secretory pathway pseudopilin PulG